jgi:hypothetical protein
MAAFPRPAQSSLLDQCCSRFRDGAGAPGGPPKAEPGAGSAGRAALIQYGSIRQRAATDRAVLESAAPSSSGGLDSAAPWDLLLTI